MHKGECLGKWGDHVTEIPNVIGLILDLAEGTLALDIGDGSPPSTVFTGNVVVHLWNVHIPIFPVRSEIVHSIYLLYKEDQLRPKQTSSISSYVCL